MSSQLRRFWQSLPLTRLKQGSTLSVRTGPGVKLTQLICRSEWRDSGHAELEHIHSSARATSSSRYELVVSHQDDLATSLGRLEPHISLTIQQVTDTSNTSLENSSTNDSSASLSGMMVRNVVPQREIDRAMVHNDVQVYPLDQISDQTQQEFGRRVDYSDGIAHFSSNETTSAEESLVLSLQTPEKLNLVCDLSTEGGSVVIPSKIEGDIEIATRHGDIRVKKLRGHKVALDTRSGSIHVSDQVEAQHVSLQAAAEEGEDTTTPTARPHLVPRVRAKQVHGNRVDVRVSVGPVKGGVGEHSEDASSQSTAAPFGTDDEGSLIDISSLYVSGVGGATLSVEPRPGRNTAAASKEEPTVDQSNSTASHLGFISPRRAVRVKTIHGPIRVQTKNLNYPPRERNLLTDELLPLVELGGVNGSCEVEIRGNEHPSAIPLDPSNENDESTDLAEEWIACRVHVDSLLPDSVSVVSADRGDISVTVDRKTQADVRLASLASACSLEETTALLAEEEDSEMIVSILQALEVIPAQDTPGVSIETKAFTARSGESGVHDEGLVYVDGWLENKSAEPDSRFERKLQQQQAQAQQTSPAMGRGKIRVESAADQALFGFAGTSSDHADLEDGGRENDFRPLIAVVAGRGHIQLETVSWLGAIARRYGLDEKEERQLGRTASRRGRSLQGVPNEKDL